MNATHLTLSWGTSRGRETYGYTICRLTDDSTGEVYRCMGGGYDMVGTVFGDWLLGTHAGALLAIADRAYYRAVRPEHAHHYVQHVNESPDALYGFSASFGGKLHGRVERVFLDGGCGIESMLRIAKAIGLEVTREYKHSGRNRGETTGWLVTS